MPDSSRVEELLAEMTVEEKVAQLGGAWFSRLVGDDQGISRERCDRYLRNGIGQITRIAAESGLGPARTSELHNEIQRYLVEETRLGIPALVHEEAVAGLCGRDATQFPQAIGLAATWDPALVEAVAEAIREHLLAVGARQALAPVLDIARDPRWGRLEETYGEDPYLAGRMGVAYVRGLQTGDLRNGVVATAKHFLGYGVPEAGMNHAPAHLGPRELRDIMAAPFRAAINEAGLASVMNAYNEVDGLPCAGSKEILDDLLRGELGFDGTVVADYFAVRLLMEFHRVAADEAEAARMALEAGIDVELPSLRCYRHLGDGPLLDRSVRRVLAQKEALGLFDDPYVDDDAARAAFDTPAQRALARRAAAASVVVCTNDGVLPLRPTGRVAVIGPAANDKRLQLGDYGYPSHVELTFDADPVLGAPTEGRPLVPGPDYVRMTTILEGLREAMPGATIDHAEGCDLLDDDRTGFDHAVTVVRRADVAVICVGGRSGLTRDATSGEFRDVTDLGLPGVQHDLVEAVIATRTPCVVVVVGGRAHALPWIAEHAAALVLAWCPGEEGGSGVAEVLTGAVPPGGRLPVTLLRSVGQVGLHHAHHKGGGRSQFYGDYVDAPASPLFPFGHGLSYSPVHYEALRARAGDGELVVSCTVTNTGDLDVDEVVQLYLRDEVASVGRPERSLAGFGHVHLAPGSSARVTFTVDEGRLGFHDAALDFVVEPGDVTVLVGSSSADIRLETTLTTTGERRRVDPNRVRATEVLVAQGDPRVHD